MEARTHAAAPAIPCRSGALISNAGLVLGERRITPDGLEHVFALNHLAPFLLTNLLLPKLTASAPARSLP